MLAAVAVLSMSSSPHAQVFNWAGEWRSDGSQVLIVTNVQTKGTAWDPMAKELAAATSYVLSIDQSSDTIRLTFPGTLNPLNLPAYPLDSGRTEVFDQGEFWMKRVMSSRSSESSVELAATTSSGLWKDGKPETAVSTAKDMKLRFKLLRGKTPIEMLLTVTVANESGELSYMQIFDRATETVTIPPASKGTLDLMTVSPAVNARISRADVLSAELSYSVATFKTGRFFINVLAQSTTPDRMQMVNDADVELLTSAGRVRISVPMGSIVDNPSVAKPIRLKFSLQQRIGELGASIAVATTDVIAYR